MEIPILSDILNRTTGYLAEKGIESARLDTEVLLAYALGMRRIELYLNFDRVLEKEELDRFRELVRLRSARKPVAYILGEREFYSRGFKVDESVLIPRPETEILVDEVLKFIEKSAKKVDRLLELGVGSGAISITLALESPGLKITAVDICENALGVAADNAALLAAPDVEFRRGDLFDCLAPDEKYDIIASNPPYVTCGELAEAAPEVSAHEPRKALDGGEDGLDFYRRIIEQAAGFLVPGGGLILEIGCDQAERVRELIEKAGRYSEVEVRKDYAGLDRVVIAQANRVPEK